MLVAKHDPGKGLDLDAAHTVTLDLGEVAYLGLSELDVLEVLAGELIDALLNFVRLEPIGFAIPGVEADR